MSYVDGEFIPTKGLNDFACFSFRKLAEHAENAANDMAERGCAKEDDAIACISYAIGLVNIFGLSAKDAEMMIDEYRKAEAREALLRLSKELGLEISQ